MTFVYWLKLDAGPWLAAHSSAIIFWTFVGLFVLCLAYWMAVRTWPGSKS